MKKYIIIRADTNDADYVIEVSEITDEQIKEVKPVIEAIKKFPKSAENWGHNYETWERVYTVDAKKLYGHLDGFETFNNFVPCGDQNYLGIHTIESVQIMSELEILL